MHDYRLSLPRQVIHGWGCRDQLGPLVVQESRRAWLASGSRTLDRTGVIDQLAASLGTAGVAVERLPTISREPLIEDVDALAAIVRHASPESTDAVIGIGGGAALDLAKAVAAMAAQTESASVREYLEGIGTGRTLAARPLTIVALPTTGGTGSEATRNAVITSLDPPVKKSLRHDWLMPSLVLIDPELSESLPPATTAHTGLDALTQLIESFLSRRANSFTDALCREGLRNLPTMLVRAVANGSDREARSTMSHAAFLSGAALANSGLGLAHGVAAALGVCSNIPHGLACAVMLPAALRFNREVRESRIAEIGRLIDPQAPHLPDNEQADLAINTVSQLCHQLGVPRRLSQLNVDASQLDALTVASRGNSLSGNPRDVNDRELREVLAAMF
jgi:alcohol dehydrogenase class IV